MPTSEEAKLLVDFFFFVMPIFFIVAGFIVWLVLRPHRVKYKWIKWVQGKFK